VVMFTIKQRAALLQVYRTGTHRQMHRAFDHLREMPDPALIIPLLELLRQLRAMEADPAHREMQLEEALLLLCRHNPGNFECLAAQADNPLSPLAQEQIRQLKAKKPV